MRPFLVEGLLRKKKKKINPVFGPPPVGNNWLRAWTRALAMSNDDDDLVAAYNGRAEAYLRQSKNSHAIDDCNAVLDIRWVVGGMFY